MDNGSYTSDEENDPGAEAHLIASKRRAGLSSWLRVSTPPHAVQAILSKSVSAVFVLELLLVSRAIGFSECFDHM